MSRTLIDLTDLEAWSGHHGGTQRVVYGIAKYFYLKQNEKAAGFIAFDSRERQYRFTSFEPIFDRVETLKQASVPAPGVASLSLKIRLKYKVRPYVPESIRKSPKARRLAVKSLKVTAKAARTVQGRLRSHSGLKHTLGEVVDFNSDDTVLILGKPWDNPDIQKALSERKAATGFKLVQVVYDLIIPLQPQLHHLTLFRQYTQNLFEAIANSDLLLPISKSTKRDLHEFSKRLNLTEPAVKVIRLGDEIYDQPETAEKPSADIAGKFIACVGTVEIRKNHTLLYYAYKLGLEQGIDLPQLVIVGSRGWLSGDFQYLVETDPAVKHKILILDNISDAGLSWIYQNCLFTVYPSMYEGWGLPVAESLAYGKVCVASSSSSIPEIAGELIDYFSPYNSEECVAAIAKYLNPETLAKKEKQVTARYKAASWEQTYKQVRATP